MLNSTCRQHVEDAVLTCLFSHVEINTILTCWRHVEFNMLNSTCRQHVENVLPTCLRHVGLNVWNLTCRKHVKNMTLTCLFSHVEIPMILTCW